MAAQQVLDGMDSLAKREVNPDSLIEQLAASGDVEKLAMLLDLKLRWDAANAKKQFDAALEAFRRNPPQIEKTKIVKITTKDGGEIKYAHAELDKANKIVTDALLAVGLSHSFKPGESKDGKTTMSLVLRGFGHTEELGALTGPPDLSGSKNAVQAIGSTSSYLARYVLLLSLGLIPPGWDDDGKSSEGLPENTILEYCTKMSDASNFEELKPVFTECWNKASACNDEQAQARFLKVYNERKKVFAARKHNG